MKTSATIASFLIASTAATEHVRGTANEELLAQAHTGKVSGVSDYSLSPWEYMREMQGGGLCDRATSTVQDNLGDLVPFEFSCSCNIKFLDIKIFSWPPQFFNIRAEYTCTTSFCTDEFLELVPEEYIDGVPIPFTDETCLEPVVRGVVVRQGDITSTACTGNGTQLEINITAIEEQVGYDIIEDETITWGIPEACLGVEHHVEDIATFKSCRFSLDGTNCPCEVCEGGSGIQLDCENLIESWAPDVLLDAGLFNYTKTCIHAGVFEGEAFSSAGAGLLSPFLGYKP